MKSNTLQALAGVVLLLSAFTLGSLSCNSTSNTLDIKNLPSSSSNVITPLGQNVPAKQLIKLQPNPSRTVTFLGPIGGNDVQIQEILHLGLTADPIFIVLKSPGGSVIEGAQIISAMEAAKGPVYTICDTLCASMAAMIFEYGTKRYMVDRSFVMFHPASGGAEGEIDKMTSRLLSIQKYIGKMESYIATRNNMTFERYKQLAGVELWIDSEDATNNGFADGIISYTLPDQFTHVPGEEDRSKLDITEPTTSIINLQWVLR